MKAIKLASVFAVTAVAAAVSTATFAAEPVFSGEAGFNYEFTSGSEAATSEGEVNITIDTGVVLAKVDMAGGAFRLDEAIVTQGAVQFGDFDGSLADAGQLTAGVWSENEFSSNVTTDLGVRYSVMPGLTVGIEMEEGEGGFGFAAAYEQDMGGASLALSAGSYESEDGSSKFTSYSVGVSAGLGMATVMASYTAGQTGAADTDFSSAVIGADVSMSEALSVSVQYSTDLEAEVNNTEVTAYYTAGDITYYGTFGSGDNEDGVDGGKTTLVGAKATF